MKSNLVTKEALRNKIYQRDGRICHYCSIPENEFISIWGDFYGSRRRGSRLEIDRKDNNRDYVLDNCVLACAICNNAKSDKFTYEEFKKVGALIKRIWKLRKKTAATLSKIKY